MLLALSTLLLVVAAHATYYPWRGNRWPVNERSREDAYPGVSLGEGSTVWNRGSVEMYCTLGRYSVSNVVWTKIRGNYEEPFYPCPHCYQVDDRIRAYNHMGKSILVIHNPGPMDQGIYRCTATAQYPDGQLTTIYQIIHMQ